MRAGLSVLAVVPARGGSKGVRLKNLRTLAGVPLVGLAGQAAARLSWIDRAVVSTDHEGIADAAQAHGLAVPFRRAEALAGDPIADWDVLHEALVTMERLDGRAYDVVLMLQPTSPFRTAAQVTATFDQMVSGRFDSVWSVSETDSKSHPLKQLCVGPDGARTYYDPEGGRIIARQQLQPVFHRNGVAYALSRACLLEGRSIEGRRPGACVIRGPVANIDTENDLALAEWQIGHLGLHWLGRDGPDGSLVADGNATEHS